MASPKPRGLLRERACNPWLTLTPILAVALAFRLYDLDAVTIWSDEFHETHYSLVHADNPNPFDVPSWFYAADPSQARLPFYLTGLGVRLLSGGDVSTFLTRAGQVGGTGVSGWATTGIALGLVCLVFALAAPRPLGRWAALLPLVFALVLIGLLGLPRFPVTQLVAGRIVAGIAGAGGVLAAYLLGREVFGHGAGLLAAATLAICPACIGWNRCAVTTGDTFVATFFVLAIWLLYRTIRTGSGPSMMACGVAFGLALAAKFSAVVLAPICVLYALVLWVGRIPVGRESAAGSSVRPLKWMTVLHGVVALPLLVVFAFRVESKSSGPRLVLWLAALILYVAGYAWLARSRWALGRRHLPWIVLNICLGGGIVAAFATPYHVDIRVLAGLNEWWRGASNPVEGQTRDYAREFLGVIGLAMTMATVPVSLLAVGRILTAWRRKDHGWASLFIIAPGVLFGAVTVLATRFPYYLMPVLPLFCVLAGGAVEGVFRRLGGGRPLASAALVTGLCVWWAAQFAYTASWHPYYVLDEKPWERSVSFVNLQRSRNLGLQAARSVVEWLAMNAPHGSKALVIFPGSWNREDNFRQWASAVLLFEAQRLPKNSPGRIVLPVDWELQAVLLDEPEEAAGGTSGPTPVQVDRRDMVHELVERSPDARKLASNDILLTVPADPDPGRTCDYVAFFPMPGGMKPSYPGFDEVYEANLHGVTGAWIFKRRK